MRLSQEQDYFSIISSPNNKKRKYLYNGEFDFDKLLNSWRVFSRDTFGPGPRFNAVLDHIRKETEEVAADPYDLMEWIDLIMLATDGAMRAGYTPSEISEAWIKKVNECVVRDWPDWRNSDPNKAIEHIRK